MLLNGYLQERGADFKQVACSAAILNVLNIRCGIMVCEQIQL